MFQILPVAMIGWQEALPVILIVVVLFGAKKLPELGRSLGEGIKEFKKSSRGLLEDEEEKPSNTKDESSESESAS